MPTALTIAGSDPSGGAGLQADLKTFHQHGVYGTSVVTLLTVQNTKSVSRVETMQPDLVLAQLDAVLNDIPPAAAKTGALGNTAIISAIARRAKDFAFPLVVDPVMISKHGMPLIEEAAAKTLVAELLPHTFLVTPNLAEAEKLIGAKVDSIEAMEAAAKKIADLGPKNVLVKGGHLEGDAVDVLWCGEPTVATPIRHFRSERLETQNTHGTGCVTSAAITAMLARGADVESAIASAKKFITAAIKTNPNLGGGYGPVNLFADVSLD